MPGISDTAYPQLKAAPSAKELHDVYTPNFVELVWAEKRTREPGPRVGLLAQLKTFQRLGYFVQLSEIPPLILEHVALSAGYSETSDRKNSSSRYGNNRAFPYINYPNLRRPRRTLRYHSEMQTEQIIAAIDAEIAKLQEAKELLSGGSASVPQKARRGRPKGSKNAPVKDQGTRKRTLSAEGRARIGEAQRKRHAARKKAAKSAAKDVAAQL